MVTFLSIRVLPDFPLTENKGQKKIKRIPLFFESDNLTEMEKMGRKVKGYVTVEMNLPSCRHLCREFIPHDIIFVVNLTSYDV